MMSALKNADPVRDLAVPYDEALLSRIVAETRPAPVKSRRRRKLVVAAWLSAILVPVAGVGAAGAAGIIPLGAKQAFTGEADPGDPGTAMDLTTARVVFSEPIQDGRRFQVWTAHGRHGYACVSFVLSPELSVPEAVRRGASPGGFVGGGCAPRAIGDAEFGGSVVSSDNMIAFRAGVAVHAQLRLADGTVHDLQPHNGWFAAWFPTESSLLGATVTGYGADGRVVGHEVVATDAPP